MQKQEDAKSICGRIKRKKTQKHRNSLSTSENILCEGEILYDTDEREFSLSKLYNECNMGGIIKDVSQVLFRPFQQSASYL